MRAVNVFCKGLSYEGPETPSPKRREVATAPQRPSSSWIPGGQEVSARMNPRRLRIFPRRKATKSKRVKRWLSPQWIARADKNALISNVLCVIMQFGTGASRFETLRAARLVARPAKPRHSAHPAHCRASFTGPGSAAH